MAIDIFKMVWETIYLIKDPFTLSKSERYGKMINIIETGYFRFVYNCYFMKIYEREYFIFLQNTKKKGRYPEDSSLTSDQKYFFFKNLKWHESTN